jgi:CRISPR system Cascade subunit CasA
MSPYHVFWGMPRRIRLHDDHLRPGSCDICSGEGDLISGFDLRHGGVNYQGAWVHPLTPHSFAESGEPAPLHMPRGGLGYRNWAALTVGRPQRSARREAAAVVFEALQDRRRITGRARVHAFGFDVDNAKIRGWYGYSAPVYGLDEEANNLLRDDADNLILAADEVAGNLRSTLGKARATGKAPDVAIAAFYRETEPAFLAAIDRLATDLAGGLDDDREKEILHGWHRELCATSERLFETWASGGDAGEADPGRVARALLDLRKWNWKKAIKDALRLPERRPSSEGGGE